VTAKRVALTALVLGAGLLVLGGWWTRPPLLVPAPGKSIDPGADPDAYLAQVEANAASRYGIVPGAEKRIVWQGSSGDRTPRAVIYLHGFSATRQEIHPVPIRVANALGANLFETRLTGHGRLREKMVGVTAEAWLRDGAEALAVGAEIGERLVVIGTSTGATLALAMARDPLFARVESLILLSPNWGPAATATDLATGPYGPQLTRLLAGDEYSWSAVNDEQERFWTTRYPTDAIVEMLRLVKLADTLTGEVRVPSALLIYSPRDDVVSVPRLLDGFERLPAQRKAVIAMDDPRSLSRHVLTGAILAPAETLPTVEQIVDFLN
jgi:esterase/lipase